MKIDKVCSNKLSQFLGLRFSKRKNLLFVFDKEKRVVMDMFFVFYPITILYLNKDKKIIDIKKAKPFGIYFSDKKVKFIIETSGDFKLGEKIIFSITFKSQLIL